jgi:hypothetical protein
MQRKDGYAIAAFELGGVGPAAITRAKRHAGLLRRKICARYGIGGSAQTASSLEPVW